MADHINSTPSAGRLRQPCPLCDRQMRLTAMQFDRESKPIYIYRCAEHGPYHVSETTVLTRGEPE